MVVSATVDIIDGTEEVIIDLDMDTHLTLDTEVMEIVSYT